MSQRFPNYFFCHNYQTKRGWGENTECAGTTPSLTYPHLRAHSCFVPVRKTLPYLQSPMQYTKDALWESAYQIWTEVDAKFWRNSNWLVLAWHRNRTDVSLEYRTLLRCECRGNDNERTVLKLSKPTKFTLILMFTH